MKKYNNQTKCYKIDIYIGGAYACSTDQSKSLKAAKERYLQLHPTTTKEYVRCFYYRH